MTKKPKIRARPRVLPNVMTTPEVQELLGGVSHVTVHKLFKKGVLGDRLGLAERQGSPGLYDALVVRAFAKTYKPQRNPPPKKSVTRRGAPKVATSRKKVTGQGARAKDRSRKAAKKRSPKK